MTEDTEHSKEMEMRAEKVPWPGSMEELTGYIDATLKRATGYGEAAAATGMIAVAAFNFAAKSMGITGFQAGFASMDVYRRTTGTEGPFMVLKAEKGLYPQYDLYGDVTTFLDECNPWLAEAAQKKLEEQAAMAKADPEFYPASPNVIAHWKELVNEGPSGTRHCKACQQQRQEKAREQRN